MITRLFSILVLLSMFAITHAYVMCKKSHVHLIATIDKKMLVSSEYDNLKDEKTNCIWKITTLNATDYVIEFELVHWFAPDTSDCSKDYVITTDGTGRWTRPLRLWCRNSHITEEIIKTRTSSLTVELVSTISWDDRVVFGLEYWTVPKDVEIVEPVVLGPINYVLIIFSGIIGACLLVGCIVLVFKDIMRSRQTKVMHFKQKLNTRRKGISGMSIRRGASLDSYAASEATSYIQLTDTPTSIRCSSAWTPSPVTRISVSTPTSENFSI